MTLSPRKKIFVINFTSFILRDVCIALKKSGIDVVYWQGYREHFNDFSQDEQNFPDTIFADGYERVKNISPEGLDVSQFLPLEKNIIERLYEYGWQTVAMMERANPKGSRFIRKRHVYYEYVKFWLGLVKKFNPDAVLFYTMPHGADQYVLYALAKILNIKTVMLEAIDFANRYIVVNDYKKQSRDLLDFYLKNKDKEFQSEDLSSEMQSYYSRQINPELDATTEVVKNARKRVDISPLKFPGPKIIAKHILKGTFIKTTVSFLKMFFHRIPIRTIDEYPLGVSFKWYTYKQWLKTKSLKKEYLELQTQPDFSKKFIYFPLHKQPEKSTLPLGGLFDDMLLAIEIISASAPDDWVIYVKENVLQWSRSNLYSEIFRFKGFYKKLTGLKNVRLIPAETSSFDLIEKCQAVATVTGTAGWEALLRDKPVIMFGHRWYQYCDGILRVNDINSCRLAVEKIKNGYKPNKQKVLNYLVALDKTSIRAKDYNANIFIESGVSYEDNVKNISEAFLKQLAIDI